MLVFIKAHDFNEDDYLDNLLANYMAKNIDLFLGYVKGSFQAPKTQFSGGDLDLDDMSLAAFNNNTILYIVISYDTNAISVM